MEELAGFAAQAFDLVEAGFGSLGAPVGAVGPGLLLAGRDGQDQARLASHVRKGEMGGEVDGFAAGGKGGSGAAGEGGARAGTPPSAHRGGSGSAHFASLSFWRRHSAGIKFREPTTMPFSQDSISGCVRPRWAHSM